MERSRVARRAGEGDRGAKRVLGGLSRLSFHLSGAQLGITVSSLILGLIVEEAFSPLIEPVLGWFDVSTPASGAITAVVALAIGTSLQLVLGELVPKNIAISHPYPTAMRVGIPMIVANGFLSPIISFLNSAANRTESRGGHAREDYPDRDDENWMKHTVVSIDESGKTTFEFRPVHLYTLTNEVQPFPPKARVY